MSDLRQFSSYKALVLTVRKLLSSPVVEPVSSELRGPMSGQLEFISPIIVLNATLAGFVESGV